jgi:hypothetical protein
MHLHSHYSADSKESMTAQVERGIEMGLSVMCFTDHIDWDFPIPEIVFDFDIQKYLDDISKTAAKALKAGKSVDFYIRRQDFAEVSQEPIHITSSDRVSIKEATANTYKANQTAGHEKMMADNRHSEDKGVAKTIEDRLTVHADSLYTHLLMDEYGANGKYENAKYGTIKNTKILDKYHLDTCLFYFIISNLLVSIKEFLIVIPFISL